jgi:tetratricopeptide (TPR) repeat protein
MEFEQSNPEQLSFEDSFREKSSGLHAWANEHIAREEKLNSSTKGFKKQLSDIKKLARKKATRLEAISRIRDMMSASMDGVSFGYQSHIIYRLSAIASQAGDRQLGLYCTAAAYRLARNTPALRARLADGAYDIAESTWIKLTFSEKKAKRKIKWAERAVLAANGNQHDFNWLPYLWNDIGECAYRSGNYRKAENAFSASIKLLTEKPPESGYFICELHIKLAEVMRGLKKPDEEIAHFETAKSLLNDISNPEFRDYSARHLKWALARSVKLKESNDQTEAWNS